MRAGASSSILWLAAAPVVFAACDHREPPTSGLPGETAGQGAFPAIDGGVAAWDQSNALLPERAFVVARADDWAVHGARLGGAEGAEWLERAGRLRERLWRLERRAPDALEALELYRDAGRKGPRSACAMELRRALLLGELGGDPAAVHRELQGQFRSPGSACARETEIVLQSLAAYRPLPDALLGGDGRASQESHGKDSEPGEAGAASQARAPLLGDGGLLTGEQEFTEAFVPEREASALAEPVIIRGIERYGAENAARVVISLNHPAQFRAGYIAPHGGQEPRVFLDIRGAQYDGPSEVEVGGLLKRIRVGRQEGTLRLALDLRETARRSVFYLPEPFRLVVDLSVPGPESDANSATPSKPPRAAVAARAVRRVVIDPGHGGHDPGAVGPSGLREKDVALDIAHRTAPLLARELGVTTLLTRDTDVFVSLPERTARANAFRADLFISIHCNASPAEPGRGIMTFVLDEAEDTLSAHVAADENGAPATAGAELATALRGLSDATTRGRSAHLAALIQKAAMASLQPNYGEVPDRGVRRAGFYVLAGAHMPAVLFEASFISDPAGELQLNISDYRQKLADGLVNAIRAYRDGL